MQPPMRSQGMTKRSSSSRVAPLELVDVEPAVDDMGGEPARAEWTDEAPAIDEPFETFYLREFPRLVVLAHALAGPAQAPDIAQEAMVVAYAKWNVIRDYQSPAGWVRGVCAHKAVSAVRRAVCETKALARLRVRPAPAADPAGGDDDVFWREVRRLPRRQAQVTALYYALDLSVADIATTLDCAEGTVKAHLFQARAALAERLSADGEVRS
jgi:RNA polymerase sigma-70 factor (ECF subfamily)